jgi:hypothetical protein
MGFFYFFTTLSDTGTSQMEKMSQENSGCSMQASSFSTTGTFDQVGALDSRTAQIFRQLQAQAEDLALELVVRLRVLAKSLAAACFGHGEKPEVVETDAGTYRGLRRQLDDFFVSLEDRDFAGDDYFHYIRRFLQDSLPWEPGGCEDNTPCRIEVLESVIALLSDNSAEELSWSGIQMPASSL